MARHSWSVSMIWALGSVVGRVEGCVGGDCPEANFCGSKFCTLCKRSGGTTISPMPPVPKSLKHPERKKEKITTEARRRRPEDNANCNLQYCIAPPCLRGDKSARTEGAAAYGWG